jgi:hypothetical protein
MYPTGSDPTATEPDLPKPAKLPPVSAYWPDLPQRIGPPADYYSWEPDPRTVPARRPAPLPGIEEPVSPATPPARRRVLALIAVAGLLAVAGAAALAAIRWQADDRDPVAAPLPPAVPLPSAQPEPATAVTPAGDLRQATFVVASNAGQVHLRIAGLAGDLYRISSPAGSGVRPSVTVKDGAVRLVLVDTGRRGPSAVDIVLSSAVRWNLQVDGDLSAGDLDLRGSRVARVGLAGDAADLRLVMPAPDGAVPIRVTGGINRLRISVPGRTPMRVRTRGGAGEVVLDGETVRGVARNTAFQTDGWRAGADGVEVDATAGLGALRAERRTS